MLAAQWLNLPVERAEFRAEPLTVAKLENIRNAENEIRGRELDERAARAVLAPYGERCAVLASLAAVSARRHNLPPRLVAGAILAESSCNPSAVSERGAVGLMQINERVWKTGQNLKDPETNIRIGTKILGLYVHEYGVREGLHHYNGMGDPTSVYADKVLLYAGAR